MSTEESAAHEAYQQAKRVIHSKPSSVEYNRCPKCGTEWIPPELGCPKCQDATNPTPAPTPRTDAVEPFSITWTTRRGYTVSRPNIDHAEVVMLSDYVALERELQAKDAEIARLKSDGGASAFVGMAIRAEKAEAKLRCADDVLTRNGIPVGSTPGDELVINLIKLFSERDQLRAEVERLRFDRISLIAANTKHRADLAAARKAQP